MRQVLLLCLLLPYTVVSTSFGLQPQQKNEVSSGAAKVDKQDLADYQSHGFADNREALSYAYGLDRANGLWRRYQYLKEIGVELDIALAQQGFLDGIADTPGKSRNTDKKVVAKLNIEQVKSLIYAFDREVATIQQNLARMEAVVNIKKSKAYLQKNASAEGVITLASGLQYKVLKKGFGRKVKDNDSVVVHYTGRTIDGKEFDSSYGIDDEKNDTNKSAEPRTFRVDRVIAGWTEALLLMQVGDKWQLTIPPSLAYGASRHDSIPANAVLIFDVELVDIKN